MNKRIFTRPGSLLLLLCFSYFLAAAQSKTVAEIDRLEKPSVALAPLRFLASDELKGRATDRPEILIAARYISELFRSLGLSQCPHTEDYFQHFDIDMSAPPKAAVFRMDKDSVTLGESFVQFSGHNIDLNAPVVFAGHGEETDYSGLDVKGRIVITLAGTSDSGGFRQALSMVHKKRQLAWEKGAAALLELSAGKDVPWQALVRFNDQKRVTGMDPSGNLPFFWLRDADDSWQPLAEKGVNARLTISGAVTRQVPAENVMAFVPGTDPNLANQFIVLSAHYDHLGVAKKPVMEDGKMDSIYNGARDNAVGVTAVIDAARYFVQHPARRPVMFIAYTGEEIGEIGSRYFASHPVIPLNQVVYNMNIDNADYNDTSIITVVGLGRTSSDDDIKKGCKAFGLTAIPDPAPGQDLFDRSDNVNLAEKGVPAPTFSLGFTQFNSAAMKHYHQLNDEVANMDLNYVVKYIKSYIMAARNIADDPVQPTWTEGDKYEREGEKLYHSIAREARKGSVRK